MEELPCKKLDKNAGQLIEAMTLFCIDPKYKPKFEKWYKQWCKQKTKRVKILKDQKQYRVTIPAEMVEILKLDPSKHLFHWAIIKDEKGYSLSGTLEEYEKRT